MFRKRRFVRRNEDTIGIRLNEDDLAFMEWLLPQLRDALLDAAGGGTIEPPDQLRRLFPVAHVDDPEAEAEYRSVMGDDLLRKRFDALDVVESTLRAKELTVDEADTWMVVINDLRLVVGTVLDVSEDDAEIDPDDPDAGLRFAYLFLTALLADLIDSRTG